MAVIEIPIDTTIDPNAQGGARGLYSPCPVGRHHIRLSGLTLLAPKPGKEHSQLQFSYEVVQSTDGTAMGHKGKHWVSCSPKSVPYFVKPLLDAAGVPNTAKEVPTPNGPRMSLSFDPDYAEGAVVEASCKHELGTNGKTYEKWGDYAVSSLNPRLAAQPAASAPVVSPAMPGPSAAPAGMPAPAGSPPPRRFG